MTSNAPLGRRAVDEANRLRWESGWSVTAIARRLEVSRATVTRWTDAEVAERSRRQSQAWKARNPSRVKAYDRERRADTCPTCGGKKVKKSKLCYGCEVEVRRARMRIIQVMWKGGHSHRQIAILLGTTKGTVQATISRMRRDGWDMPYRAGYPRLQEAA